MTYWSGRAWLSMLRRARRRRLPDARSGTRDGRARGRRRRWKSSRERCTGPGQNLAGARSLGRQRTRSRRCRSLGRRRGRRRRGSRHRSRGRRRRDINGRRRRSNLGRRSAGARTDRWRRWLGRRRRRHRGGLGEGPETARERRPDWNSWRRTGFLFLSRLSGSVVSHRWRFDRGSRLFLRVLRCGFSPFRGRDFVLVLILRLFDLRLFNTSARAVSSGGVTTAPKAQAQLLRHVLVDRAGVGLLLRDAQFRQ
jgi:hypothetical protein